MSTNFSKAMEPRNWFDWDKQMEGWGRHTKEEEEANAAALAKAEREKAEKAAEEAEAKKEQERREALKKKKGLAGTILTSGLGITEDAKTKYATLLGR
jgi:membrane protein involved in colicin uptake